MSNPAFSTLKLFTRFAIVLLLFLAACSPDSGPSTSGTPTPTAEGVRLSSDFPGVIYGVEATQDGYILNDSRICLALLGDAFWEAGDYWDSPDDLPRVEVRLNDNVAGTFQPTAQWGVYEVPLLAKFFGSGANVIEFRYDRVAKPSEHDPGSHDERELAVRWDRVTIAR